MVATCLALAACGGSPPEETESETSSAPTPRGEDSSAEDTTESPSPEDPIAAAVAQPHIAVVADNTELLLVSPSDGSLLAQQTLPLPGTLTDETIPDSSGRSGSASFDYDAEYILSPDFTRAVGIQVFQATNETVPVVLDLATAEVSNLVAPSGEPEFGQDAPALRKYLQVGFHPETGDIWALELVPVEAAEGRQSEAPGGDDYIAAEEVLQLDNLSTGEKLPVEILEVAGFGFVADEDEPIVIPSNDTRPPYDFGTRAEADEISGDSGITVYGILRSSNGDGSVAFTANSGDDLALYRTPAIGEQPTELTDLAADGYTSAWVVAFQDD